MLLTSTVNGLEHNPNAREGIFRLVTTGRQPSYGNAEGKLFWRASSPNYKTTLSGGGNPAE
jgi:hypothetical protein